MLRDAEGGKTPLRKLKLSLCILLSGSPITFLATSLRTSGIAILVVKATEGTGTYLHTSCPRAQPGTQIQADSRGLCEQD